MADFTITSVADAGNDVLLVTAEDAEGNELLAQGWVSATTNHFDEEAYDANGNLPDPSRKVLTFWKRTPGAVPRAMTPEEVGAYARRLIEDALPEPAPEPTPLDFA